MKKFSIKFTTLEDVNSFCKIIDTYPVDIDACVGRYVVDAKSILALLSIGMSTKIDITIHTDNNEIFDEIIMRCKQYVVAN